MVADCPVAGHSWQFRCFVFDVCRHPSTLNFSFFGYSEIMPQTVPAKIANLTEIVMAFVTVIFLLSDFISLKDSIRSQP